MNESDTVDHIMSCKQPASFRGERFVPLEGEQMKTTAKKEVVEEEKPNKLMKNLTSFVKNTGSELAKLAKSMEEEDEADAQFVCMICGKKLSAEKMQNHTKHCKVPKGFKGSQFMVFESDEMRMKQQEEEKAVEEEKPVKEEKPAATNPFDAASESEEESGNPFGALEEKPEEKKPATVNPFDAASESEEEGGNPFGAPEKEEEKKPEEKKPEEKPVEEKKPVAVSPFDAPSEEEKPEEKPAATNPFDAASESEEESGNPFGAPEEKKEEKIEEKPAEKEKEEAANPFNAASESEEEQEEKMDLKMRFGLNSLMKNATKSFARLAKSMEEEDEADAQFVCMICGKKLSAEKMQNHTKHCKVPKGFKGSQFMVFESDEMRMKQQEEEKAVEEEKPVKEEKPAATNPFDAASESEEESGNPFGALEEKPEEKKPATVNPFDAASESEEEGGNPFGAPEKEEEKPAAANPFDAPSKEEDAEPAALEPMPNTPNFLSKQKKQKSIFNLFRREGNERKGVSGNIFSSLTQSITSTVSNIVNVAETEEEAQARLAREEEERIKREEAERLRREEEERLRKEREEAERKRREEEERIRKKAMMEQKLTAGIACKKYCWRGKPHPTTVSLITHASKGQMVGVGRRGKA